MLNERRWDSLPCVGLAREFCFSGYSWAALLPSLFRCLKELQLKTRVEDLISWRMWPSSPPLSFEFNVWIRTKASDSNIAFDVPISIAKRTPWCSANTSVIVAGRADGRSLLNAPIVAPVWSLMMTPMLERPPSFAVAPSTLILWKPNGGRDQWVLTVGWEGWSCEQEVVKSIWDCFAITQAWAGGQPASLCMALFLFPK